MSLPKRNEREYLKVEPLEKGFAIVGQREHTEELAILFSQHGIPCAKDDNVLPGEGALRFGKDIDRAKLEEVLDSYKRVKGS